jgi:hypothetical protein
LIIDKDLTGLKNPVRSYDQLICPQTSKI